VALRLVVLRALGLGDLLTAVPALRALARAYPDHDRVLLTPAALAPIVDLLDGAVDAIADTHGSREPPAALPAVAHDADVAINLHGRGPQSTALLRAARPRRLISFGVQARWHPREHEVTRWCRVLAAAGIAAEPRELDLAAPAGPAPHPGATVVHPGASTAARRWPPERWVAVAREAPAPVVVTAGPGEDRLASSVALAAGAATFAGGLGEMAALVAGAGRVLCADTGIAHLATALGTPSVVLFGPTSPAEWGPPPERAQHRTLWAGRRGDPHAGVPDRGLLALQPEDVLGAARGARRSPTDRFG
jgi:ADP-heptose:LPS heptosyltransferase